ncbi:hypothetical protein N2152v2_002450 [Parachlorella kessleri]
MPPKPVRGPTRRTSALLPETQRANFLLEAASLLSQGSPQLAAVLGRKALQVGDTNHAALPRGAAASLCGRCGLPFSADVYQNGQVLKLPRHLVRRKLEAAARGEAKLGAQQQQQQQQQQQVNRAAVLYTCKLCGHVTVRPFYTLEAARQAIVRAGGTPMPAVAPPGSMPAAALGPAPQQQQQQQQVATRLGIGAEAAQPGLEASAGSAAAAVGATEAQEAPELQQRHQEQRHEPEYPAGDETSMQREPSSAAAVGMGADAGAVEAAALDAAELAAGLAHEKQRAACEAEGSLEAAAGEATQAATALVSPEAADPVNVHDRSQEPVEHQQQKQQASVDEVGLTDMHLEQQVLPTMPAQQGPPSPAMPSAAREAELRALAGSTLAPNDTERRVAAEAPGLALAASCKEAMPPQAGTPPCVHVTKLPATAACEPLPPAGVSPAKMEALPAEPAERPTAVSEPPSDSGGNPAAPPARAEGRDGIQEPSLGAATATGVVIAATATPPTSSCSPSPPREARREGLAGDQGIVGSEAAPDEVEGEQGGPSSVQEPPRKRRRISWREELEDVQYIPAGPGCGMKAFQQGAAAEMVAELQELLGSPASAPLSPLGAVRRQAWFRVGRAWKYGRV